MRYAYNLDVFRKESATFYYLLGAYMTDGCVSNKNIITITSKDIDWLITIKNLICSDIKIYTRTNSNCGILQIRSNELAAILINKGCIPRKSLTLKFPDVPKQYLPDFLRGCTDGDGCIHIGNYERTRKGYSKPIKFTSRIWSIVSGSQIFLEELHKILLEKNIGHYFTNRKHKPSKIDGRIITSNNLLYIIRASDKSAYQFLKWIYYDNNPISMNRKEKLAKEIIRFYEEEHEPRRKIDMPNKEWLEAELLNIPIKTIANNFNCTEKVIRRWIKIYNLKTPGPGYWTKIRNQKLNK